MRHSHNFFVGELLQYYRTNGIILPEEVAQVLCKDPLELSDRERDVFVKFILPRRHHIKQALGARLPHGDTAREAWRRNLPSCSRSIIGQIAMEMLFEEEVMSRPAPALEAAWEGLPDAAEKGEFAARADPHMQLAQEVLPSAAHPGRLDSVLQKARLVRKRRRIFSRRKKEGYPAALGYAVILGLLLCLLLLSPWGLLAGVIYKSNTVKAVEASRVEKASNPVPPTIALVVDDAGETTSGLERWLSVEAPLTFSIKPKCKHSQDVAERLYASGYRIMMHVPTENYEPHAYADEGQITSSMDRETVWQTLDQNLESVPHASGLDNHDGEKGCGDLQLMVWECEWARDRGLFVVDSRNFSRSQVSQAAVGVGLEKKCNQVFIDIHDDPDFIRSALRQLAELARQNGVSIGACTFGRRHTPSVLAELIPQLEGEGIHFAFVEEVHN
jgi:polysaccharide deacetylase 2 family uncharacterized protein YibQ